MKSLRCEGCKGEYPRAWCMFEKRWQHCNTGVYFTCTAPDAKTPPSELA